MNPHLDIQTLQRASVALRGFVPAIAFAAICISSSAAAQLTLNLRFKFVDQRAGGNGNIGVTQDEKSKNFYVLDFSNTMTVHEFDGAGKALGQFAMSGCTPRSTSPNGVCYDPFSDTLWVVDNNGGGTVTNVDRKGKCLGGFNLPPTSNAVGITFNRLTKTLFVSRTGGVDEYDLKGKKLTGGFNFTPVGGSSFLSGITWVLPGNRLLVTQSGGNRIFELDMTGKLLSTTSLTAFGIGNTQGLNYHFLTNRLTVVDNSLSTTFVFDRSVPAFQGDVTEILFTNGGTQVLKLNAGSALANKSYWIFGSATGTTPGFNLNGVHLPLNPDVYSDLAFVLVNTNTFKNFKGTLDSNGSATASFNVPKVKAMPAFTLNHAYIVFDTTQTHMASNAARRQLDLPTSDN